MGTKVVQRVRKVLLCVLDWHDDQLTKTFLASTTKSKLNCFWCCMGRLCNTLGGKHALRYLGKSVGRTRIWSNGFDWLKTTLAMNESPVTVFCPPYEAIKDLLWSYSLIASTHIARNFVFSGIFYVDELLDMDGKEMTSINGENWIVSVLGENVFLRARNKSREDLPMVMVREDSGSRNVLGRNGVIHFVDGPLIDRSYSTVEIVKETCTSETQKLSDCIIKCANVEHNNVTKCLGDAIALWDTEISECSYLQDIICDLGAMESKVRLYHDPFSGFFRFKYLPGSGCLQKACTEEAHELIVCYAKESDNKKDLSSCPTTVCPTPAPTPVPPPYPTMQPSSGDKKNETDLFPEMIIVVVVSLTVLIGIFLLEPCCICCWRRWKSQLLKTTVSSRVLPPLLQSSPKFLSNLLTDLSSFITCISTWLIFYLIICSELTRLANAVQICYH